MPSSWILDTTLAAPLRRQLIAAKLQFQIVVFFGFWRRLVTQHTKVVVAGSPLIYPYRSPQRHDAQPAGTRSPAWPA
jgi:hypothetical protein